MNNRMTKGVSFRSHKNSNYALKLIGEVGEGEEGIDIGVPQSV